MISVSDKWYSVPVSGLFLVLASLGVKRWYGPDSQGCRAPGSAEQINRLITDLYQNGVIDLDGRKIIPGKDHAALFDVFSDAERCICEAGQSGTAVSYFSKGRAAVMEPDGADSERVRMICMDADRWPGFILRECVGFDGIETCDPGAAVKAVKTLGEVSMSINEAADCEGVAAVFDDVDLTTGETRVRIMIRDVGIKRYITLEERGEEEVRVHGGGFSKAEELLGKMSTGGILCL